MNGGGLIISERGPIIIYEVTTEVPPLGFYEATRRKFYYIYSVV